MEDLIYAVSEELKKKLEEVDSIRLQILDQPILPKKEYQLRFEATVDKIFYSFVLSKSGLSRADVVRALKPGSKRQLFLLKSALDEAHLSWHGSITPLKISSLTSLYRIFAEGKLRSKQATHKLRKVLGKLQEPGEHPIVKALYLYISILYQNPFSQDNALMAHVAFFLVLEKYGYDMHGFLVPQKIWKEDYYAYEFAFDQAKQRQNCTIWIQYATESIIISCQKIIEQISEPLSDSSPLALSDRQTAILEFLAKKEGAVTNKKVQKMFGISQITASRELVSLAKRGLLKSHGKGRSVRYVRM